MVQRLSWEDVLLSTLTEPSLMKSSVHELGFDVSRCRRVYGANSTKHANDQAGYGGHDQQEDRHGDRPVLVFVVHRRTEKPVAANGFNKTAGFFKRRYLSSRDAFSLADFATHGQTRWPEVIALAKC